LSDRTGARNSALVLIVAKSELFRLKDAIASAFFIGLTQLDVLKTFENN